MIDNFGLYVQKDGDVGDSSHRTGLACALYALLGDHQKSNEIKDTMLQYLEVEPGIYHRHPYGSAPDWAGDTSNFSRDQASRVILGLAVNGEKAAIKRWLIQMTKRFFLHQNNMDPTNGNWRPRDIMAPGEWRNVIRGLDLWYLYPILMFLDMFFLTDLYLRSKWDGGSLFFPDLVWATKKYPTPISSLARLLARKTSLLEEIKHNHSAEMNGCVELIPLFEELDRI